MKKYNLTRAQLGVLYAFDENGNVSLTNKNYIWGHLRINQEVDFNRLKDAINYCFKKNDSIRIKLCKEGDNLMQYFANYEEQDFEMVDIDTEEDIKKVENEVINSPFEMFDSFLYKVVIYRYKSKFGGVILKLNHVIADGYTMGLLLYEVLGYYSKLVNRIISFSYLNYIRSDNKYPFSRKYKQDKKYWNNILDNGVPDSAYIPYKKEEYSLTKVNKLIFNIDDVVIESVKSFCREHHISYGTFYMSVFAIYIYKTTELTNFFLAVANKNRNRIKDKLTAGMMSVTSYFNVKIQNDNFLNFARRMRTSLKSGYKHMNYISGYTQELFEKYNDNRGLPTNVILSYQNLQIDTERINIDFDIFGDNNEGTYGSDIIIIHIFEYKNDVKIIYDYLSEKYSVKEITDINNAIQDIIKQVSKNNNICIKDIVV